MNILEKIIQKQNEYQEFLNGIETKDFEQFTRDELKEFVKKMYDSEDRIITLEVNKIIERKKFEEYPELLSVHHYPELKELNYLSEEQLIQLDKELAMNRGTRVTFSLKSYIEWDTHTQVYEDLIKLGILKAETHLTCNCMRNGWLSKAFDEKDKEQWIKDLKKSNESGESEGLLKKREYEFFGYCEECEDYRVLGEIEKEFFEHLNFKRYYVKVKERQTKWDKV